MNDDVTAVYHTAARQVELQPYLLPKLEPDHVLIQSQLSAISPGTEAMIFAGQFPKGGQKDLTIPSLQGDFSYPFRYGYSLVGNVVDAGCQVPRHWLNCRVFTFHPHQTMVAVRLSDCIAIPDDVASNNAVFLPNMEAAVNFVMDAAPVVGEKVLIIGQGVVGLLTTCLLAQFPVSELCVIEPVVKRRKLSLELGALTSLHPDDLFLANDDQQEFDLAFELSGNLQGLNQAIGSTRYSGRIIIGSWYGNQIHKFDFVNHFHRSRIKLISSQVSTINPELSGRWTKQRRINLVWHMLKKIQPQSFITHRFPVQACQQAFTVASQPEQGALQVIFDY